MDETKRQEVGRDRTEEPEAPETETREGLSKEDVDVVAGGRPPIHTPPQ